MLRPRATSTRPSGLSGVKARAITEGKQTLAGAYAKIDSHEDLCAERYRAINEPLGDLKSGAKWIIGLLVALVGWFAVQMWDGNKADIAAAQRGAGPTAVSVATSPAPSGSVPIGSVVTQ